MDYVPLHPVLHLAGLVLGGCVPSSLWDDVASLLAALHDASRNNGELLRGRCVPYLVCVAMEAKLLPSRAHVPDPDTLVVRGRGQDI